MYLETNFNLGFSFLYLNQEDDPSELFESRLEVDVHVTTHARHAILGSRVTLHGAVLVSHDPRLVNQRSAAKIVAVFVESNLV